jgi:hypothetical protein
MTSHAVSTDRDSYREAVGRKSQKLQKGNGDIAWSNDTTALRVYINAAGSLILQHTVTHTLPYDTVLGGRCRNRTDRLNLFCVRDELRSLSVLLTIAWLDGLVIGLRAGRSGVRFSERARDFSLPQFVPQRITCRYPVRQQSASLHIDRSLACEWATQTVK